MLMCFGYGTTHLEANEDKGTWGFYGHKLINKLAVYLLPDQMLPYFILHINHISDHAIDPDKRRYASKFEGIRHYMDMEYWLKEMDSIPLNWYDMLLKNTVIYGVSNNDTTAIIYCEKDELRVGEYVSRELLDSFKLFIQSEIAPNIFRDENVFSKHALPDTIQKYIPIYEQYFWKVDIIKHGILPYNLIKYHNNLTRAFESKDHNKILRYVSDLGHYIGDAHVPLHTTANYNGQLSNQLGIHAFWETRIPELFAETTFDLFNEKAMYIDDISSWYWSMVLQSHELVPNVLDIERQIASEIPRGRQYIMTRRGETVQRTQTEEYAKSYEDAMGNMVEEQMSKAIWALSCAWMTAWIDAGQPKLEDMMPSENKKLPPKEIPKIVRNKNEIRGH